MCSQPSKHPALGAVIAAYIAALVVASAVASVAAFAAAFAVPSAVPMAGANRSFLVKSNSIIFRKTYKKRTWPFMSTLWKPN